MTLITIVAFAVFGFIQDAKPDDKKPTTPFLKTKIAELDKLFRASIKANSNAKTTADKQDAAALHQEIIVDWCENLDSEQVDFEVVIEDIVKNEVSYFAKTTSPAALNPFKPESPYRPLIANQSLLFELTDDQKVILTIGTKLKVTGNLLVSTVREEISIQNQREFAKDRIELLKVFTNPTVIAGNKEVTLRSTLNRFYLDEVKLEVIGVPKPLKPTKPTKPK